MITGCLQSLVIFFCGPHRRSTVRNRPHLRHCSKAARQALLSILLVAMATWNTATAETPSSMPASSNPPGSIGDDASTIATLGDGDESWVGLERALPKAIVFEGLSSAGEVALFIAFFGNATVSAPTIFAISLTSATAVYVVHELAWEWAVPETAGLDDPEVLAARAATYRVVTTLRSFTIGSLLGAAEIATSAAYAVTYAVLDTILYVANDVAFAWFDPKQNADSVLEASTAPPSGSADP